MSRRRSRRALTSKVALAVAVLAVLVLGVSCSGNGGDDTGNTTEREVESNLDPEIAAPTLPPVSAPTSSTLPTPPAQPTAPTFVVDPAGNDSAAGSESAPWKTLRASIPKLKPGDVLLVRNGTYAEGADDASVLRARVTSKNGTTERALLSMEANNVKQHIVTAAKAAAARAKEMGDELGGAN